MFTSVGDEPEVDLRILGKERGLAKPYPLIWHLLDSAAIATALWDHYLNRRQRAIIAAGLGADEPHARSLIAFWAGLHDIGKATPAFQHKVVRDFAALTKLSDYPDNGDRRLRHDEASQIALVQPFADIGYPQRPGQWSAGVACRVSQMLGAHHGWFKEISEQYGVTEAKTGRRLGSGGWRHQREVLFSTVYEAVGRPRAATSKTVSASAAPLIVGVVVVADWLASQESFITAQQRMLPGDAGRATAATHFAHTAAVAVRVLSEAGLGLPLVGDTAFTETFDFPPNPLQRSIVDELVPAIAGSGLLVVTAATGDGKTEAGLVAACALARASGADGLYFALPTMATADQMYRRVAAFTTRLATGPTPVTLLHSMSWLNADYTARDMAYVAESVDVSSEDVDTVALATAWLRGHRRGLLAPFAVGTVDQALLAALAVKHNSLRMLGLSGKVLVVDEAHAYDAYMQALLRRLLNWLGALGCPVVLLSATLPSSVSASLIEAYLRGAGRKNIDAASYRVDYPGWLFVPAAENTHPVRVSGQARASIIDNRTVELKLDIRPVRHLPTGGAAPPADDRLVVIVDALDRIRRDGGCAAVVCNTVDDAQRTFLALRAWREDGVDVQLLHSRFPARVREEITQRVMATLGRDGADRPPAAIVVSTQIVEQSLDLDFDVVVSDLAPIAQLLQRAGRCHRHPRPLDVRRWLGAPRLVVLDPRGQNGEHTKPRHWGAVYDPYLLRATHLLLAGRAGGSVKVPHDVQELVEAVYVGGGFLDDRVLDGNEVLARERVTMQADEYARRGLADFVAIAPPSRILDLSALSKKQVEEADAVTRLGADSVRVVCTYVDSEGQRWLDEHRTRALAVRGSRPRGRFTAGQVREILAESIPIRADEVIDRGDEHVVPKPWTRDPWLRDLVLLPHRLTPSGVEPARCGSRMYHLDPDLGLMRL